MKALENRPEEPVVVFPPCPMCSWEMEPHASIPGLLACYQCKLSWNPVTKLARAMRRV